MLNFGDYSEKSIKMAKFKYKSIFLSIFKQNFIVLIQKQKRKFKGFKIKATVLSVI